MAKSHRNLLYERDQAKDAKKKEGAIPNDQETHPRQKFDVMFLCMCKLLLRDN